MKKFIAFVLVMIMAISLVACADTKNLTDSLSDIYSAAIASADMDEDTKSHYELAEMYSVEFDADTENLNRYLGNSNYEYSFEFSEGLCVMFSFGGGFQVVLVRLNSTTNADEIENELKTNFDKNQWVCMSAEAVETARIGDVILLVAGGTETVQQIIDGFNAAYNS